MSRLRTVLGVLLLMMVASCADDDYHYPSVKLEFLTALSGADGALQSVLTDEGERLDVAVDGTGLSFEANAATRIVTNYERVTTSSGGEGVKLYAGIFPVSPTPRPAAEFKDGICTDAAEVTSIWMGLDYLNILLVIKAQNQSHAFHFIEDQVLTDAETGNCEVYLTLYHDAGDDLQAYTKRVYLSVPLQKYLSELEEGERLTVHFSLHTYDGTVKTYDLDYTL